jgi:hypothetical protein
MIHLSPFGRSCLRSNLFTTVNQQPQKLNHPALPGFISDVSRPGIKMLVTGHGVRTNLPRAGRLSRSSLRMAARGPADPPEPGVKRRVDMCMLLVPRLVLLGLSEHKPLIVHPSSGAGALRPHLSWHHSARFLTACWWPSCWLRPCTPSKPFSLLLCPSAPLGTR